jgi:dTMP kinase
MQQSTPINENEDRVVSDDDPRPGRFISIEGTDGAGKTTQIGFIAEYLRTRAIPFVQTREPGGTALGEAIRELLLGRDDLAASARSQLLLVFAARNQHLEELVRPALARGDWVVCDRFTEATYAYQGGAGGIGFPAISTIENWVQGSLRPDLTLLLDLPVEDGLARVRQRGQSRDRFDTLEVAARHRIREAYLRLADDHPERIVLVDARPAMEEVSAQISRILTSRFGLSRDPRYNAD